MPKRNEAYLRTMGELATRAHLDVMAAGRETVQESSVRWRRVTDGNPCGFCAMLASRGPVYTSAAAAGGVVGRGMEKSKAKRPGSAKGVKARGRASLGGQYHGHCGCTVEPFDVSGPEWQPTPTERRFIDAYDAVYAPGMVESEVARLMDEWLADPANSARTLSIDGMEDDAVDALLAKLADEGNWIDAERIGELLDARLAERAAMAPKPWAPNPADAFNPQTYEWFEGLSEDAQFAFLDQAPGNFLEQQWAWKVGGPTRSALPAERQIRAEWDSYVEAEWVRLEGATNGVTLSREAIAAGHHPRELLQVNAKTARKWASEEVRRYWDENGRMTYESFKAGYAGGVDALNGARAGFWA